MDATVWPVPEYEIDVEPLLSEWQFGTDKPTIDGAYIRDFDEGEAISWWFSGAWHSDNFFYRSDVQDTRWKGLREPLEGETYDTDEQDEDDE